MDGNVPIGIKKMKIRININLTKISKRYFLKTSLPLDFYVLTEKGPLEYNVWLI
ncbi:MAG: hypothetical protein JG781_578 [Peptococcaceae bacterium]|jgi:hypothetical protein|nr:hypothetical protein [Peptococcaceae bacterium]